MCARKLHMIIFNCQSNSIRRPNHTKGLFRTSVVTEYDELLWFRKMVSGDVGDVSSESADHQLQVPNTILEGFKPT